MPNVAKLISVALIAVALAFLAYVATAPTSVEQTVTDNQGHVHEHAVDLGGLEQVFTIGSESRADRGSVSRLKNNGHLCTIVDNEPNFRNAAGVCSNLNGRAVTVRDKNGVRAGSGRKHTDWRAKAHVGMEWKDAQGDYHGAGPVSRHR